MMNEGTRRYIRAVTDLVFVQDAPEAGDVILIPGSLHEEHVLLAAKLYRAGYAPWVLPSGRHAIGLDRFEGDPAFDSEWAWMRSLLMANGVPDTAILREDRATYTWENAQFSRRVTDVMGLQVRKALLCCRAFHAARAQLYYQAAFPEARLLVCPAPVPGFSRDDWFLTPQSRACILGEVRRLGDQVNEVFEMMLDGADLSGPGQEHE